MYRIFTYYIKGGCEVSFNVPNDVAKSILYCHKKESRIYWSDAFQTVILHKDEYVRIIEKRDAIQPDETLAEKLNEDLEKILKEELLFDVGGYLQKIGFTINSKTTNYSAKEKDPEREMRIELYRQMVERGEPIEFIT